MRALYFLQIDRMITKMQGHLIWLFIMIAVILSFAQKNPYWGSLYMVFGSMILSSTPFTMNPANTYGFLLMLPATVKDRVFGRFLYGLSLLLLTLFFGGLGTVLVCIVNHIELSSMILIFYIGVAATALIMLSIQYTIFYLVGELKSQQVMGLIRMIPGFLLFILGSIAMDIIQEESNSNLVFSFLTWINNHLFECVLLVFLIAVLIFLAGIFISVKIQKKRDFG